MGVGVVTVVIIIGVVLYIKLYRQYADAQRALKNPTEAAKQTTKTLVEKVSKLILLPEEEPTLANVTNVEKLRIQPFFTNALNGDIVLIYQQAKKAVLYRPSTNQIIEVAPLTIGDTATPSASTTTPVATVRFLLLNGTTISGLTKKMEDALIKAYPEAIVADRDTAKKKTYEKSILIDIKGTKTEEGKEIAKNLNLELSTLPAAEATTGGTYDFIIITGADRK